MKFAVILDVQGRGAVQLLDVVSDPTPIRVNARIATLMKAAKDARRGSNVVAIEIDTDEAFQ